MNGQKEQQETEQITTLSWVKHTDVMLPHPVRIVWPVFRDMSRWYSEYHFETVSGPPYQSGTGFLEGQVVRVKSSVGMPRSPNTAAVPEGPEHFLVKTLKVTPEREIVVVLSGNAYDWRQIVQFYVWRMAPQAEHTALSIDAYGRVELFQPIAQAEASEYESRLLKNWHRSWSEALQSLKSMLVRGT